MLRFVRNTMCRQIKLCVDRLVEPQQLHLAAVVVWDLVVRHRPKQAIHSVVAYQGWEALQLHLVEILLLSEVAIHLPSVEVSRRLLSEVDLHRLSEVDPLRLLVAVRLSLRLGLLQC